MIQQIPRYDGTALREAEDAIVGSVLLYVLCEEGERSANGKEVCGVFVKRIVRRREEELDTRGRRGLKGPRYEVKCVG